jgi:hypothetical protein
MHRGESVRGSEASGGNALREAGPVPSSMKVASTKIGSIFTRKALVSAGSVARSSWSWRYERGDDGGALAHESFDGGSHVRRRSGSLARFVKRTTRATRRRLEFDERSRAARKQNPWGRRRRR